MDMTNNEGAQNPCKCKTCACPHHKALPVLIILFGLLFLLGKMNIIGQSMVSMWWPVLVIAGGLVKLTKKMCKCC